VKKDFKFYILNSIYNIIELLFIISIGILLKTSIKDIFAILIMFSICRWTFPKPKHYKQWYKCFFWSSSIFVSLYLLIKIDIIYALLFTMFNVLVLSGKCDICDIFLWKGCCTKYQDICDYIKYNPLSDELLSFEEKISKQNNLTFMIYKYRFKEQLTFQDISEKLDIDTQRITEELDKIAFSIRMYCKI
jgi:hypothetical protein